MDPQAPDVTIAELVNELNRGQYLLLVAAIRGAGGELRIDPKEFASMAQGPLPKLNVDGTDGAIVLRLQD